MTTFFFKSNFSPVDTVHNTSTLFPYWQAPRWGGSVTRCPSTRRWSGGSDPWTVPRRTGGVEKEVCGCLSSLSLTAASTPARPPTPSAASAGVSTSPSWYDTAWFSVVHCTLYIVHCTTYVPSWPLYQWTTKNPLLNFAFDVNSPLMGTGYRKFKMITRCWSCNQQIVPSFFQVCTRSSRSVQQKCAQEVCTKRRMML